MRRVSVASRPFDSYGSVGLAGTPLARVEQAIEGFAVDVVRYAPGAVNGRHPTGLWQLLTVVSGVGWAAGPDVAPLRIAAGDAVLWEPGEEHSSGSDEGMVTVIVQSPVAPLPLD